MAPGGKIETYEVPQNPVQAAAARDGLAKSLYERIFDFLVARINSALDIEKQIDNSVEIVDPDSLYSIGTKYSDCFPASQSDRLTFSRCCL